MDHHSRWGSVAELRAAFGEFVAPARPWSPADGSLAGRRAHGYGFAQAPALELELAVPGPAQPAQRPRRARRLEPAGFELGAAAAALADFPGVKRRLELKGARAGARIYDDYAHHPTEVRAALSALREHGPAA